MSPRDPAAGGRSEPEPAHGALPGLADTLLQALPELLILLRRDGTVLAHSPGRPLAALQPARDFAGEPLHAVWSADLAELLLRLARKAIAQRSTVEAAFQEGGADYELRASARGPDRAMCVIRAALPGIGEHTREDGADASGEGAGAKLDRRGFLRLLRETLSMALLRERPLAVAVLHLDGIADVARLIDAQLSERIMATALLRLAPSAGGRDPWLFLGQLGDSCLALAFEYADREQLAAAISRVCASLSEPLEAGGGTYQLTAYAGAAVLSEEVLSAKALLDRAHAAAAEARRSGAQHVVFFTEAVWLGSHSRPDVARELRNAIEHRDIRLRYVGRHELASGRRVAWVGYVRWAHPLRGEMRPVEFLPIAETTGLATELSRAVLQCLREDCLTLRARSGPEVQISFGALRHHVLHEDFLGDIGRFLADGALPARALELRISERTFVACEPALLQSLHGLGVQLVVDEVARDVGSLDRLARAPLWGLQLDRAWVTALRHDAVAHKVCRAGIAMASGLGLTPIATGVDDAQQRDALLALGCRFGSGDLYGDSPGEVTPAGAADGPAE